MNSSWKLIPKILSGEKTIESRWYQTRRAPWKKIQSGDRVFFKDAGKPVTANTVVSRVECIELSTKQDIEHIIATHGNHICLVNTDVASWGKNPKYCILIWLKKPEAVTPFLITKKGFGAGVAWITIKNIDDIRV